LPLAMSGDVGEEAIIAALDRVLDEWLLTGILRAGAQKFIRDKIVGCSGTDKDTCVRVRQWLLLRMNKKVWQHGVPHMGLSPDTIPGVRTIPVWPNEEFSWLSAVEDCHQVIVDELLSVRGSGTFQPYRDPPREIVGKEQIPSDGIGIEGVDRGAWNVAYLFLNHKKFEDNCSRFPRTIEAISSVFPRHYTHAFFSALTPNSHILPHHGPSNRMLRVWLPLCGLDGFRLRVGDQIVTPQAGKAFVWDHSFEHEAWHDGDETRIVLIVDIWHPDLTDDEVKFLKTLQNARLKAGRELLEREGNGAIDDTYYGIVERTRGLLTSDDWWVIKAERGEQVVN